MKDGGWLLHSIRWKKDTTYWEVAEQYGCYLLNKYGLCCFVFDGYEGPSTKDHEHLRRSAKRSADITVTGASKCHRDQEAFFTNTNNKTQFIALLVGILQSYICVIYFDNSNLFCSSCDTVVCMCLRAIFGGNIGFMQMRMHFEYITFLYALSP